jgi:peptidoglycan hydrolase-like protein with peptidoglycan-binding domain
MLDRHIGRRRILGPIAAIGATLLSGAPVFAIDGPSFDCTHGVNSALAIILCSAPEAARADWDLVSAYWAFSTDNREQTAFSQSMNQRCALPQQETPEERVGRAFAQEASRTIWGYGLPISGPQPITRNHVRCVITAFRNRAAMLRSKLKGDALAESNLSPEKHQEIQVALINKGFLRVRYQDYGANADGQFGPNTRSAIKDFQRHIGARETGFLSNEQRMELLESPQERQARAERAAATEKARQEALEAQKRAGEQAEKARQEALEAQKRAEEQAKKARQEALEAQKRAEEQAKRDEEKRKQDAIEQEKKRLEAEAEKAEAWGKKIEEAKTKGPEYAARIRDITWSLSERMNPMTEENEYTVYSTQPNGGGAVAAIEGACLKDRVVFQATLLDAADSTRPLAFPTSVGGAVVGNKRINDGPILATNFPTGRWRNRVVVSTLSFGQDSDESADTTWRTLAEVETSQGTVYIKVPMYNAKIQTLIASCQRQHELWKRRDGRQDALPRTKNNDVK